MKYLAVLLVKYTFDILAQLLQVGWNISLALDSGGFKAGDLFVLRGRGRPVFELRCLSY